MPENIISGRTCGSCYWRQVVGPNGELECWHDPPIGVPAIVMTRDPENPETPVPNHVATFTVRPPVRPTDRGCSKHSVVAPVGTVFQ